MFDMKNVISVVGAAIVASVVGSFMMFECPDSVRVPKPETLYVISKPKFETI